jgi:hypothetical protein
MLTGNGNLWKLEDGKLENFVVNCGDNNTVQSIKI